MSAVDDRRNTVADEVDVEAIAENGQSRSQVDRLMEILEKYDVEFVRSKGKAYVTIALDKERRATYAVRSQDMRHWLSSIFYKETRQGLRKSTIGDALDNIEARALNDEESREIEIALRVGGNSNAVEIDLGGEQWNKVLISAQGWDIVPHPQGEQVFRRSSGMKALPTPERGGRLDLLRKYIKLTDEEWSLLASWLVASSYPCRAYMVLFLIGEQGSSKSTTARMLRSLVDPSRVLFSGAPKNTRDVLITAEASWVLAYDNLSSIEPDLSDALCGIATGTGYRTRALYTDADEVLFDVARPILLTGINNVATRGDLADRTLTLRLRAISEEERRDEDSLWKEFERDCPRILGALYDALSLVLRYIGEIRDTATYRPRMLDAALIAQAAEPAFGVDTGTWARAHHNMRSEAHAVQLEHPIARAIFVLLDRLPDGWNGTATELLQELCKISDEVSLQSREWPKDPTRLSGTLGRLAPSLRIAGIQLEQGVRSNDRERKRLISIRKLASVASAASRHAQTADAETEITDAEADDKFISASDIATETDIADTVDDEIRLRT